MKRFFPAAAALLLCCALWPAHAVTGETAPLTNRLGVGLRAVYAHSPGHEPWQIAGPLASGETATVDLKTLQGSRRLIVEAEGEVAGGGYILQFFNHSYLGTVDRMDLVLAVTKQRTGEKIPALLTVEDGRRDTVVAGLPFDIFLSYLDLDKDFDSARYADLIMPLGADGQNPGEYLLTSGNIAWRLAAPGPIFTETENGDKVLASLTLAAGMNRRDLLYFLNEFYGGQTAPTALALGDGTELAFGEEGLAVLPGARVVKDSRDADAGKRLEILTERLGGWLKQHVSPDRPTVRLFLASPRARYQLLVDFATGGAELHIRTAAAGFEADGEHDDSAGDAYPAGLNFRLAGLAGATEPLGGFALPDGRWWLRELVNERPVVLESRRLEAGDRDEKALRELILAERPGARDITVAPFTALAEKTSYPALRARFLTGEGPNTRLHLGALLSADDWSFWFVLDAPADYGPYNDPAVGSDPENWLEKSLLTLESVPGDAAMPGRCLPVYNADFFEPEAGLPDLVDALARIELLAAPSENPWLTGGDNAYRYDGIKPEGGDPRLLFSFGGDSQEKFTAERHFAVDGRGRVYEMDVVAGPEYGEIEETPPPWWGEYRDGDKSLRISNFRQGPEGFYFLFSFEAGGKELLEGAAAVGGRRAAGAGLLFRLERDDESLRVSLEDEAEEMANAETLVRLEGVYTRR